jgi:plasmid stabilization system protein ParE
VKKHRLVFSDAVAADIVEQADWYSAQSGKALAERREDAVTSAIMRVLHRPKAGTPCQFHASELHDLRRTAIPGFPKHLFFYRFDRDEVLMVRVVRGARDLEPVKFAHPIKSS